MSDVSGRHLLLIGGWTTLLERAMDIGAAVSYIGATTGPGTPSPEVLARCAHVREAVIDRVAVCLDLARQLHDEQPVDAVTSFTEAGLESAAVVADALGVAGLELWPTVVTRHKDLMRQVLDEHPRLALPWRRVTGAHDVRGFFADHGPEIIVKPVAGLASVGIRRIRSADELDAALADSSWLADGDWQAEELVDGDELYSVESLSRGGEHSVAGFSYSRVDTYPHVVNAFHMVPPPPEFDAVRDDVVKVVREFLTAIGLRNGVAHTEVKIGGDGRPVVIESHTRVGGDRIWWMLETATAVPQIALALRDLLGGEVDVPDLPPCGSVLARCTIAPPAGTVRRTADPAALLEIEGVLEAQVDIAPGQELATAVDWFGRSGSVFLRAPDHAAAALAMAEISRTYWVEFEDGHVWHPAF